MGESIKAINIPDPFVRLLLLKLENDNKCPRCSCRGRALNSECSLCRLVIAEREKLRTLPNICFD